MTVELRRFIRFLAVGVLNTVIGYACYAGFILLKSPLWLAVAGSTILGVFFNFMSYGNLVFGGAEGRILPRFILFYLALGCVNFMLLRSLIWVGIPALPSQALLLPILVATAYFGMRRFVFGSMADRHIGASNEH
jgi:putative flippase GtrA